VSTDARLSTGYGVTLEFKVLSRKIAFKQSMTDCRPERPAPSDGPTGRRIWIAASLSLLAMTEGASP
jgi:hypothetical protein